MEFGICFYTHVDKWDLIRHAEDLGYDRAWVPDSQMIWSDCYATMALAAHATKRIKIGTGVAIAGVRIAPVTAHSIASINQIAPGRAFLGIGTGHTAMRVMGQDPMPVKEFREYLRVVRALLNGEAVEYTYRRRTREIQKSRDALSFGLSALTLIAENLRTRADSCGTGGDCGKLATGWRSELNSNCRPLPERLVSHAKSQHVLKRLGQPATLIIAASARPSAYLQKWNCEITPLRQPGFPFNCGKNAHLASSFVRRGPSHRAAAGRDAQQESPAPSEESSAHLAASLACEPDCAIARQCAFVEQHRLFHEEVQWAPGVGVTLAFGAARVAGRITG
jgi:hypothetical protein